MTVVWIKHFGLKDFSRSFFKYCQKMHVFLALPPLFFLLYQNRKYKPFPTTFAFFSDEVNFLVLVLTLRILKVNFLQENMSRIAFFASFTCLCNSNQDPVYVLYSEIEKLG